MPSPSSAVQLRMNTVLNQIADYTPHDGYWRDEAACHGHDTEAFFIDEESGRYTRGQAGVQQRTAFAVCASCPVRLDCLHEAVRDKLHGIWGGHKFGPVEHSVLNQLKP